MADAAQGLPLRLLRAEHRQRDAFAAILFHELEHLIERAEIDAAIDTAAILLLRDQAGPDQLAQMKCQRGRGTAEDGLQFAYRHPFIAGLDQQLEQFEAVFMAQCGEPLG